MNLMIGWMLAGLLTLLRWTCRTRWHDDPRPSLRKSGKSYLYAILHCHQVGAAIGCERGTAAMVSRSSDGDLIAPSLIAHGVIPIRGSGRKKGVDKGGAAALELLAEHVRGGSPAYLAIDGPRGPRGHVQPGIARLALATDAAILVAIPLPRRRWILERAWDRFQIPKPFTSIEMYFAEPVLPLPGESEEELRARVAEVVARFEKQHDPLEAEAARESAASAAVL